MKVAQLCPTLSDPMDEFSRTEYWNGAFPFSKGSSQPRDQTQVSSTAGGFFTNWATREALCLKENFKCKMTQANKTFSSVQFSHSVLSNSLWPHGLQHARLPCSSPTLGVYSNWCPLCWWCHPTISSSVIPFSSHLQSFLASGSFPISRFFASGGQSFGVSALASVLPKNIQDWFPLGLTGWISLLSKELSRVLSKHINSSALSFIYSTTLTSIHTWLLEKPQLWLGRPLWAKQCLCFSICYLVWS